MPEITSDRIHEGCTVLGEKLAKDKPEYIEREAVLKVLHHRIPINEYDKSLFYDGGNMCLSLLEEFVEQLPTADVAEVKHAEWVLEYGTYGRMICSLCKEEALANDFNEYVDSDFCPHCGADMRGK